MRYQCPVPVTTSMSLVLPPYHATVRRVRSAVCATTSCGDASFWPFTRGRPIVLARARGRRLVQGGIAIKLADQGEVTAMLAAKPCGLAGAVARIPHKDEVALWKPAHHARQQQPGQMRWRFMARPMRLIPLRGAIQGHQDGERPGPDRERQLDQHRHDHPLMPPPIRRIAVGRAHAIAMPSLAKDVGARVFCDRIIAGQEHRARRDDMVQQERDQQASQRPGRPAAL